MRLNKALYGLGQSPRVFNQLLMQKLLEFSMERCAVDPYIFRRTGPGKKDVSLTVGVNVDDLIVTGRPDLRKSLLEYLKKSFPTKNLGALSYYIGCGFVRNFEQKMLSMSQTACIDSLVRRFAVTTTSPTPAAPSVALGPKQEEDKETFSKPY